MLDQFQSKIWNDKYRYNNESFHEFCHRIASSIFDEQKEPILYKKLYSSINKNEFLFGGRILSNIGISSEGLTLFNCFIEAVQNGADSLEGIIDILSRYIITLKSEGGVGFCANFFRPEGTIIRKIGVTTPGVTKFLELFDKASEIITAGNVNPEMSYQGVPYKKSIRKGATMVTLSICHPDIEAFITAKNVPNKLTKMNLSVLITDEFINAVETDSDWNLWFPDISFEKYNSEWNGDFDNWQKKGYPYIVYRTIKAPYLWNLLLENSFNRNEPGVLFIDNARKMDNLFYLESCNMLSSNPCVTGNTLVTTKNGLFRAKDVKVKTIIQNTLGYGNIESIETHENHDVYRVYFSDGFYQDVTEGHIFHTMTKTPIIRKTWDNNITVKNLEIGSFVRKEWYKNFPELDGSLSRDDGLLVGLYLGDGSFSNSANLYISANTSEDNSYIIDLYHRIGGKCRIDPSEGLCSRYYLTEATSYIRKLVTKLNICTKGKSFDILSLLNTNRNFIIGLIDGLLSSDGNVNRHSNISQVRFTNSSPLLHSLMKHLMLFVKADYKLYGSKKAGEISIIYGRKVVRKHDALDGIIDNDSIYNLYTVIEYLSHPAKNKELQYLINTKQLNGVRWKTSVTKIEYLGKETVYDFYESTTDNWNHEGYVARGCGEVIGNTGTILYNDKQLTLGDICNLGSINLTKFYNVKTKKFDYEGFLDTVEMAIKALDRVIDISKFPLSEYEDAAKLKRKIGVGIMGLGSLFMMMNIRYGGDESVVFTEKLLSLLINKCYATSALLAKELGPFELYNDKLLTSGFIANGGVLTEETLALIRQYGLRNSALSAIAPNGSLAIMAGNISGGLEPVFSKKYFRWNRVEGKKMPFKYPDVHKGEWFETDYLKESVVNGEKALISIDNKYRIDHNTGLCEGIEIVDYGYSVAEKNGFTETLGAMELGIDDHLRILSVFAKYIDQSCSKSINISHQTTFEDFKKLYGNLYKMGIKGCTTYREGTSIAILETNKAVSTTVRPKHSDFIEAFKGQKDGITMEDVQLPEEYPAKGYILNGDGKKWYVHVAFKDNECKRPFAIFVSTNHKEDNVLTFNTLEKLEELFISCGLRQELIEETHKKSAYQKNPVKICRMLGLLLRHNISILHIVEAMNGVEQAVPGTFVFRIKKFLSQFITEITEPVLCPACNEKGLVFQEGCFICIQCGYSKCA